MIIIHRDEMTQIDFRKFPHFPAFYCGHKHNTDLFHCYHKNVQLVAAT